LKEEAVPLPGGLFVCIFTFCRDAKRRSTPPKIFDHLKSISAPDATSLAAWSGSLRSFLVGDSSF
jgi:hypothetical protein